MIDPSAFYTLLALLNLITCISRLSSHPWKESSWSLLRKSPLTLRNKMKKILPLKKLVIGASVILVLFIVFFYLSNPNFFLQFQRNADCLKKMDYYSKKVDECSQKMDDCSKKLKISSQKADGKSIELAHCERKLNLKDENIRKAALNVITPWLAPIIWNGIYNLKVLNEQHKDTRIGLFVVAVKKYIQFLGPFLESAERFFMVGHNVTYYVFTDKVNDVVKPKMSDGRILQLHEVTADKRWQDVSMGRMEILTVLTKEKETLPKEIDYLVCADVDMVFNDHMGVEILGDLFATIHPGMFLSDPQAFTYERRPISAAYIPYGEGDFYYMAALYGGKVEEVHNLTMTCHNGIKEDKKKNIEAIWHEESHFNRYLLYNKPTKVLSPEYIWDTRLPNGKFIRRKRFLAVHKNHEEVRN